MKRCNICGYLLNEFMFHKNKMTKDGLNYRCRDCTKNKFSKCRICKKIISKKDSFIVINNKYTVHSICYKEKKDKLQCNVCRQWLHKSRFKKSSTLCKKCYKKRKDYYEKNKEKIKKRRKEYYKKNKESGRKSSRKYIEKNRNNPFFRINVCISSGIRESLKNGKNDNYWKNLVDFNLNQLMLHLEKQFTPEMTWENYGMYWEIDHIIPKSKFNFISYDDEEFKMCWCLDNLQPLEKTINREKKDKIDIETINQNKEVNKLLIKLLTHRNISLKDNNIEKILKQNGFLLMN